MVTAGAAVSYRPRKPSYYHARDRLRECRQRRDDRARGAGSPASCGLVRSSRQWIYALFCAVAVSASPGCNQPVGALQNDVENNSPITSGNVYLRQLDLDVAAI